MGLFTVVLFTLGVVLGILGAGGLEGGYNIWLLAGSALAFAGSIWLGIKTFCMGEDADLRG